MRIGLSLPNNWGIADVGELIEIGILADTRGFHALWTSEHLTNVSYVRDRIGDAPYYSALSILSALAVRTTRVQLGTSVLVLPFHSPFFVAKYFATLDHLSKGRAILGAGIGNVPEEFAAVGIAWKERGALTDEAIDIIQALWSTGSATHAGRNWMFEDVHTSPKPFGAMIPIWIGGISAAALRRTARVGRGWQAVAVTPDEFQSMKGEIVAQAIAIGRDPQEIAASMRINITFEGEGMTEGELKAAIDVDRVDTLRQVVDIYRSAGATDMIFALNCRRPDAVKAAIAKIADALAHLLYEGAIS
ncbi:TIGR03619 family F420-dependent LLM class oxidoreductase [Sphingobium sp. CR2-8]|uniref:TIGR03619 family F420-dependent LLM class oxidoreductase n=1 Tax=Sphingobium sp. CR2-8 TaxID=1306534 RepID=UPI002DBF9AD4|nr:TIGR03619 family F420-dependent LLM class oxidoreductase [Sphingobium sp. CR2-8]MEC3909135.1 TIGR03619 family F420-dependent LLM class oxidoreductase [Sphingobium sp. CR2-8]